MMPNYIWYVGLVPKKVLVLEKKVKKSIVDFKLGCKFALGNDEVEITRPLSKAKLLN